MFCAAVEEDDAELETFVDGAGSGSISCGTCCSGVDTVDNLLFLFRFFLLVMVGEGAECSRTLYALVLFKTDDIPEP